MMFELYALRVDGQFEPRGVTRPPTFSWRLRADRPGALQSAFRLRVTQVVPGDKDVEVWDSGLVDTWLTTGVHYAGAPLRTSTDYYWTLEVIDDQGVHEVARSRFASGILQNEDWSAVWIGRNPNYHQVALPVQDTDISYTVNKLTPVRRFLRHFDLEEVPLSAKVHASARGVYRLYINGCKVGNDELAPGWTEYRDRSTYQSWDVSSLLHPGRNSIAALLGDGWYVGFIGTDRRHQAQHYGQEPALLVQLMTDSPDGSRLVIGTDTSWKESPSDILYADLLMGQYEDSRQEVPEWYEPEDLSTWLDAVIVDEDVSLLTPECDPGVRVTGRVKAVSVTPRDDDRLIVDFGQNLVGRVHLKLRNQLPGTRIQLTHAEMLDQGELYTENLRTAEPVDIFWTNGEPEQVFEPRFTVHGFRYVEVRGVCGLDPQDIEAVVLHNDFEFLSEFSSSNPDLDHLFSNILWSLRSNFLSIPTDCPQRDERLGWLADAQVFAPTALVLADVGPGLRRWLRDVRSAQNADGAFPDLAPQLIHRREGAPAWGDGGVTIPWHIYRASGDVAVLEEAADSMLAWVRHIERHNPDLIWREQVGNNYGDWLQVGEETSRDLLATAYFAHSTDLTARSLQVLGRTDEAEAISDLRARIADAYRKAFISDEDGTAESDTQGAYLLTLAFDLCADDAQYQRVAKKLTQAVLRRGISLTTGFITAGLLCPVLAEIGREDLAFQLLHYDRYPSWLYPVRNGATTIWERWDGWTLEHGFQSARMNSFNHYSLGSVGQWFISGILGITQTSESAGYRDIVLAPRFDPYLEHAEGFLETPRGRIESSWNRDGIRLSWKVRVPPGPPASAQIPRLLSDQTTLNGQDIPPTSENKNEISWSLESGGHEFQFLLS